MFTPEDIIDYVQNTKKQVVAKIITDKAIAANLDSIIDAEADYTKAALKNFTKAVTDVYVATSSLTAEISKKFKVDAK